MTVEFGQLPFVYVPRNSPTNGRLPSTLPFRLVFDDDIGLVRQVYDAEVERCLRCAYDESSQLSGMMDESGIGRQYADDFLAHIQEETGQLQWDGLSVLDVGCGTGYLLSRLEDRGARVVGLEPGEHGQVGARRFGVTIVRDYFPSPEVVGQFDLITAFGVLEHVVDCSQLVKDMYRQLKPEGRLILAVPDCRPYLESGDISFLFHEHWNYFTAHSLGCVIRRALPHAGLHVTRAGFGGTLYASVKEGSDSGGREPISPAMTLSDFEQFVDRTRKVSNELARVLRRARDAGRTVGIYVPGRAVNILAGLALPDLANALRFFDDNPLLEGTYFPGFNIPVESRRDLLNRAPEEVIVMSQTFGEQIAAELTASGIDSVVTTWRQLCERS